MDVFVVAVAVEAAAAAVLVESPLMAKAVRQMSKG
jgi:hypothetical protein